MKIPGSVRTLYYSQHPVAERLKDRADTFFRENQKEVWHYESRVKTLESFALKLESGRFRADGTEDLFAATLVVRNRLELGEAEDLVRRQFEVIGRRPDSDSFTKKRPECFPFDDIRLYVKWKDNEALPPTELSGFKAEVQIKTYLLHAWSVATHPMMYKTPEPSWGKARIASQIRAMLEAAEIAIEGAETMARGEALQKENAEMKRLRETIELIREVWDKDSLPSDLRRLGSNVAALAKSTKIGLAELRDILARETSEGRGAQTKNLSPFGVIVQSIVNQRPRNFERFVRARSSRFKILLTPELELPSSNRSTWVNTVSVPS